MLLSLPVGRGHAPEEGVVFHALLPEVLAVIPVFEVELDSVFVVALSNKHWII